MDRPDDEPEIPEWEWQAGDQGINFEIPPREASLYHHRLLYRAGMAFGTVTFRQIGCQILVTSLEEVEFRLETTSAHWANSTVLSIAGVCSMEGRLTG